MPENYEEAVVRLRTKHDVHVNRLDHVQGLGLGAIGGGAAGVALSKKVKNPYAKAATGILSTIGGGLSGAALNPHSLRAKRFSDELKGGILRGEISPEQNKIPDEFIYQRAADMVNGNK